MCGNVVPPLVLLNRPPDSDATIMVAALLGCTAIVFARPPLAMSGWNSERVQPKKSHCAAALGDEKRKKRTERATQRERFIGRSFPGHRKLRGLRCCSTQSRSATEVSQCIGAGRRRARIAT